MKTPLSHRLSLLASTVAATWTLVACAPAPVPPTPTAATVDVKVGLIAGTATAPLIVPFEEGQFAARGLNVSLELSNDTVQPMISAAAGQYDLAYVTLGPAAFNAFNRGMDLTIIAAGTVNPPGHADNLPVVVRSELVDSGAVKTVADLRGRKFAINVKGGLGDYKLAKALATGGLTSSDVDVAIMPIPDMVVALSTGAIDAGLLLQPTAAQAVAKGVGKILLDDYDQNDQAGLAVANTRFLQQHRQAVTNFLAVYLQAIRRLADGKIKSDDQALAALQRYTNVPPDVIRLGPDPYWPSDGHILVGSLREQQGFYISNKLTDYAQPLEIERLIDYGPLDDGLKNIGG